MRCRSFAHSLIARCCRKDRMHLPDMARGVPLSEHLRVSVFQVLRKQSVNPLVARLARGPDHISI